MAAPTKEEKELISKFRLRLKDINEKDDSDAFLLRWIRARDNNLDKAEEMFRHNLEWRKEHNVDTILKEPLDDFFRENFPFWVLGTDKKGNPVLETSWASWDLRKIASRPNGHEYFFHYSTAMFENVADCMKNLNAANKASNSEEWPLTQCIILADMSGFCYSQLFHLKALNSLMKMVSTFEAHYPEFLYRGIVYNCPSSFSMIYFILKKCMAPKTLDKVSIIGTNKEEWLPVILELIDEAQLGTDFGGTCTNRILDNVP